MLHMPLTTYTNAVLLHFLKKHKIKPPKQKTKDNIIELILQSLGEYVIND
jgi:hypothetical protein